MDVKQFLRENGVEFSVGTHFPRYTAQEVAAADHVSGREFAKVVIAKTDSRYVMVVLPATRMVDPAKLASVTGTKSARLAEEFEMRQLFPDSEVGAEVPFGNLYGLETLVDRQLALQDYIVFQSGTHRETIRIRFLDYERLARPEIADVSMPADAVVR